MALTATFGQGLQIAQGRKIGFDDAASLSVALAKPTGVEAWWSCSTWTHDKRDANAWTGACGVALDLDGANHAPLDQQTADKLETAAREGGLAGSLFHRTPAGARVVFVFDTQCTSIEDFDKSARGAAALVQEDLKALGVDLEIDPKVHLDRARLLFTPNAHAKGVQRKAEVVVMQKEPFKASELSVYAPAPKAPLPQMPIIRPTETDRVKRAKAYVEKMGPSIEGNHGDDHAFKVAATVVRDFGLTENEAWDVLYDWNTTCEPPWSERDLKRFIRSAEKNGKHDVGAKLDERPPRSTSRPALVQAPSSNSHTRMVTLAAGDYEPAPLIKTGINALDHVLRGGIPLNKLAVIAARTSHGKTATTVRLAVNMVLAGRRVVVLWCEDEEVEFDLRALSVLSGTRFDDVLDAYRAKALAPVWARVSEAKRQAWRSGCSTVRLERPCPERIADHVASENGAVFLLDHIGEVDWGDGRKHELIGDGLRLIRTAALDHKCLFVAMAQLNRDWDRRKAASENPDKVRPCLSDIENSGQIEQVARVCIIAEKSMVKQGEEEVPTGEYRYHVFKPMIATAVCRWHDQTYTPDNVEPVRLAAVEPPHWSDREGA